MKSFKNNQSGFSFVEILIVLLLVGVVIFAGNIYLSRKNNRESANTADSSKVEEVPDIKSSADLQKSEDALKKVDIDQLNTSEIDASIEEML